MVAFRFQGFGGIIPRTARRLLPEMAAQAATNIKPYSGDLEPLKQPLTVNTTGHSSSLKNIARIPDGANSVWLGFTDDTDVVRAPVAGDTTGRRYYTSEAHEPRVTNLEMAKSGGGGTYPATFYALGVPAPITAPTLAAGAGGAAPNITVAYVYTFVTAWGEESIPSPAALITILTGQGVNLSALDVAPPNSGSVTAATWAAGIATITLDSVFGLRAGERTTFAGVGGAVELNATFSLLSVDAGTNQVTVSLDAMTAYTSGGTWAREAPWNTTGMTKRIYRTLSGSNATDYQFVDEIPVATTTYADTVADGDLGELIGSLEYDQPPTDLRCIAALPGGAMVGVSKNQVCFSEPYKPHAWPSKYRQTMAYNGVAIGVYGSSMVVATDGFPYVGSGTDPESITLTKAEMEYPCISKRGAVAFDFGLMYPSYAGLVLIGVGGTVVVTEPLYTADNWKQINPATLVAAGYNGRYYGIYTRSDGGNKIIILDRTEGVILLESDIQANAIYGDLLDGNLYIANVTSIQQWDGDDAHKMVFDWLSKEFLVPKPINPGAAKVEADFTQSSAEIAARQAAYDAQVAANDALLATGEVGGEINADEFGALEMNGSNMAEVPQLDYESLQFSLYNRDELVFTTQIVSNDSFWLPSGYKTDAFSYRISGNVRVRSVSIAETLKGLEQV